MAKQNPGDNMHPLRATDATASLNDHLQPGRGRCQPCFPSFRASDGSQGHLGPKMAIFGPKLPSFHRAPPNFALAIGCVSGSPTGKPPTSRVHFFRNTHSGPVIFSALGKGRQNLFNLGPNLPIWCFDGGSSWDREVP